MFESRPREQCQTSLSPTPWTQCCFVIFLVTSPRADFDTPCWFSSWVFCSGLRPTVSPHQSLNVWWVGENETSDKFWSFYGVFLTIWLCRSLLEWCGFTLVELTERVWYARDGFDLDPASRRWQRHIVSDTLPGCGVRPRTSGPRCTCVSHLDKRATLSHDPPRFRHTVEFPPTYLWPDGWPVGGGAAISNST